MARYRPSATELSDSSEREARRVAGLSPARVDAFLQAAEGRRSSIDQMMWQVPALSLTAQSFLLTIALGSETRWVGRLIAAALGLVAALAAIQLLLKHRYHELVYSYWLERFEDDQDLPNLHSLWEAEGYAFAGKPHVWHRDPRAGRGPRPRVAASLHRARRWLVPFRSPHVWIWALILFALADATVIGAWLVHAVDGDFDPFG